MFKTCSRSNIWCEVYYDMYHSVKKVFDDIISSAGIFDMIFIFLTGSLCDIYTIYGGKIRLCQLNRLLITLFLLWHLMSSSLQLLGSIRQTFWLILMSK
jgi:hypothetical protein